ncbi:PH domain-containing protein [Naumannella sp. ID2617S]|nr:PH domain-containing protein [Naumannella sp. ID2617S]
MGVSAKELAEGERVVLNLRTHPKALWLPFAGLLTVLALLVVGLVFMPPTWQPVGVIVLVAVVVLLTVPVFVAPLLKWRSRTYTITDRRIMTRQGILNRTGHDIQLRKVNAVAQERSLSDRVLGCGTLKLDTASEAGTVVLPDVPRVEEVARAVNQLLFDTDDRSDH